MLFACGGSHDDEDAGVDHGVIVPGDFALPDLATIANDLTTPPDLTAPSCTALLCDDFESGAFDPKKWTVEVGGDKAVAMTVESTLVAHGSHAAQAHLIDASQGQADIKETLTFPALQNEIWGRFSFQSPLSLTQAHTAFVSVFSGGKSVLEIGDYMAGWQLTYYPAAGGEMPQGSSQMVPRNAWACLEWHFKRNATKGENLIEVYIDGTLSDSYAASGTEGITAFDALSMGMQDHGSNPAGNDVYLDDVAINATRIGCPL